MGGGMIPEDADRRHEGRELGDDGGGGPRLHVARGVLDEDEAERVRTCVDGAARVLDTRDAADLDPDHERRASSRTLAGTSGARTSPSPTRTARAPARTTDSTSVRVKMPLSLTAVCARGIRGSRARDGSRLVSSVWRFRLLTPMTGAPRATARSSSEIGRA